MKPSNTLETKRLAETDAIIDRLLKNSGAEKVEYRLQLLEAAASRLGGFDLEEFQTRFEITPLIEPSLLTDQAREIVQSLDNCEIHPILALSALARETLDETERKSSGAYHTDFRLALHLAHSVENKLSSNMKIIDPACGAGILLAAVSIVACGSDRILANEWLRNCVYAADLSPLALRGTLLSLSGLTDDLDALYAMRSKWRVQDSLLAEDAHWKTLAPKGFDLVIANPPWEKVKLSRHEFVKANGEKRHYGSAYGKRAHSGFETAKLEKARLASKLVEKYPALKNGEPDLYVAFTELLLNLTRSGGSGAILVPAGLIRSLNTQNLRQRLIAFSQELSFTVMDNKARHFAIDTRFKFLLLNYVKPSKNSSPIKNISISHAKSDDDKVRVEKPINISVSTLRKLRPDLTLPEVRTISEWRLFKKMQGKGASAECQSSKWYSAFCREVDMTHGRPHFIKYSAAGSVPLIEGRMVQPHRLGCKSYGSGQGRSAVWHNLPPGRSTVSPQFWMPIKAMSAQARSRVGRPRAGFCDITGQTNERSMMAALVPKGVICGNKVPTIEFPNDPSDERIFLWLSIVNSFPFDWLLRRVVTTTVNYFVLRSVMLPSLEIDSLPARRLIEISKQLSKIDKRGQSSFDTCWRIAKLKAETDVLVANAYGCTEKDVRLMLQDFPLLDRGQPAIPGENRSSVTTDLLLHSWFRRKTKKDEVVSKRVEEAMNLGAIPYLSSEFLASMDAFEESVNEQ